VRVRDGKLIRMHDYLTREEAEAAGGILGS
jgi:hypothetical protein